MARGPFAPFLRSLDALRRSADGDAALLERFTKSRDESAFAELVRRHGPLVWGVCRQVLGHDHDADDAFQATFLLLARRAPALRNTAAVASWLHGTACRVAAKARRAAAARTARERRTTPRPSGDVAAEVALRELQALLHEEVARLPAKCRVPFVLCVLEGRARSEAARDLGWNEGTLSTRLADARKRLRVRLARRGVDVAAALVAVDMSRTAAPAALVDATAAAAVTGRVASGVAVLVHGGIGAIFTTKVQQVSALALMVGALAVSTAGLRDVDSGGAPEQPAKGSSPRPAQPPAAVAPAPKPRAISVHVGGRAIGPDNQPVLGATVYLVVEDGSKSKTVWTSRADVDGRYRFHHVAVPVATVEGVKARSVPLQLCGTAPGLAFAWKPRFTVESLALDGPPPLDRDGKPVLPEFAQPPRGDLVFGKAEAFAGRIVDEQGKPVTGAKVRITFGDWLRRLLDTGDTSFWMLAGGLPESMTTTTTGVDGRFRLDGVPRNFLARLAVTHPGYAELDLYTATTDLPVSGTLSHFMAHPDPGPENPVWTGAIDLTLVAPRAVPVRVVSDKSGQPVPNVNVSLFNRGKVRVSAGDKTDAAGRVMLQVPPGEYRFDALAPHGTNYLRVSETMTVAATPAEQPRTVRMTAGCTIEIEVTDADTGFPVRKVRFEQESPTKPGAWDSLDDTPTGYVSGIGGKATDKWGKMTVYVRPGKRAIRPTGEFVAVGEPKAVELPAGGTVKLQIRVREKE